MKAVSSKQGDFLLGLSAPGEIELDRPVQFAEYTILFIPSGSGIYQADFAKFSFAGPVLLFSTPYQELQLTRKGDLSFFLLQFHSDFYCIEYHKADVSCNGLLFNNIYLQPFVSLSADEALDLEQLFHQLGRTLDQGAPSEIVVRAYLQLLLARASSSKIRAMAGLGNSGPEDELMEQFRELLDRHFLEWHKPNDYARVLRLSSNVFTKRSKRYFGKSPSQLIQERLLLEAKKQLHLTRKSIKEIAYELKFGDEFYFSRVFKKFTQISPQTFRKRVGISVVADLSM